MTVTAPENRSGQGKRLDAGMLQPEISSFRLQLAAEGKAAKTVRMYTEAVQWFAAHWLQQTGHDGWEKVGKQDVDGARRRSPVVLSEVPHLVDR
jgi:hypothetical protein